MNNNIVLSVVIPNFNRKSDILELLGSLYDQKFEDFEIIVVDDNSTDGSIPAIKEQYPQTIIIPLPKNMGPAVARNFGIKSARGEIIVGLDSDTILQDKDIFSKITGRSA